MKKITFCLFFLLIIITFAGISLASCKKYNDNNYLDQKDQDATDTIQLLTAAPWKLLSYGFDHNENGTVDQTEDHIDDCKKTNVYQFNTNGSGTVSKDKNVCNNDTGTGIFSWTLTHNRTILDFINGTAFIAKIDKNKMVLTDTNGEPVKLITIYGH